MAMELSFDLVEEILSWVPCKSLERFRCTCKQWETLISEPRFINKHLFNMRGREQQFTVFNDVSLASDSSGSTVSCVGIDFYELNEPRLNMHAFGFPPSSSLFVINIYHCDGLLLCVMTNNLLVLNPMLKQERWIKYGKMDHSIDAYGLGYVSSNRPSCGNNYKMVRFPCGKSKDSSIKVYELKSSYWKVVDKSFDGFLEIPESSVCLRGTPYWIGFVKGKTCKTIESFDFSKEGFETLFLPPSANGSSKLENSLSLGVFRGEKLSLLHESRVTGKIQLWVMKKHWSKLMTFSTPESSISPRYSSYFIENNGKLVLSFRGVNYIKVYIAEKDDHHECQNVETLSMDPALVSGSGCYYTPSLLPVPGFDEAKRRSGFVLKRDL
ncbi:hypothetical protein Bca4012_008871 [Brassica carinata]|uniref:F-box domain-containing protein n=1 Tax=Brassica carinata TaxID=52824 RepID=A0A8X7S5N5_BRACI|nr:hypothetical protein Bca52824_037406 [Brassica carinata]